jgi:hypothetical protein
MRFMGKTGASMSGEIGFPSGPNGGSSGEGRSAWMLYHCRGISSSVRNIFVGILNLLSWYGNKMIAGKTGLLLLPSPKDAYNEDAACSRNGKP